MLTRYPADRRNLSEEDHLILKVLRLYYEHNLNQGEIARRMGFSRPKVSKLISEGRARGLVKIESVAAAIRGGYVSTLVCDRELAEALLETER